MKSYVLKALSHKLNLRVSFSNSAVSWEVSILIKSAWQREMFVNFIFLIIDPYTIVLNCSNNSCYTGHSYQWEVKIQDKKIWSWCQVETWKEPTYSLWRLTIGSRRQWANRVEKDSTFIEKLRAKENKGRVPEHCVVVILSHLLWNPYTLLKIKGPKELI